MRVLIADDHELVRRGICTVLLGDPSLTVCGEAVDGRDAVEKVAALRPDLVIMDITMPKMNGLEATRKIKGLLPEIKVVIVSQHESTEMIRQAFSAGAGGYVVKSTVSTELLKAIAKISRGEPLVSGQLATDTDYAPEEVARRRAEFDRQLRQSDELHRAVITAIWEIVWRGDKEGRLLWISPRWFELTGQTEAEAYGWGWGNAVHADDLPRVTKAWQDATKSESQQEYKVEWRMLLKDGSVRDYETRAAAVKDGKGTADEWIGVLLDITERKQAERAKALLAAIVDSSDDAIISKSLDGTISSWNKSAARLFGHKAEEAIGKHISLIIPADRLDEEAKILERLKRGERIDHFETVRMRKDGTLLDISLTISPVKDAGGDVIGASKVARDITERKRMEQAFREKESRLAALAGKLDSEVRLRTKELEERNEQVVKQSEVLRELSNRLLQSQEEERRRVARELHDGVGQLLSAMAMGFAQLGQEAQQLSPKGQECLSQLGEMVEQASQEVRTASHLLHPPLLDEVGLDSAVRWYVDGFSERSKIAVRTEMPPKFGRDLPRHVTLSLFRVVQECLTNIHRHSGSETAVVAFDRTSDSIRLEVSDEGKGIATETQARISAGESGGVGLRGMRERVRQFGGRLEIESSEKGTRIVVVLPITEPAKAD